jgi:hypothetical protein
MYRFIVLLLAVFFFSCQRRPARVAETPIADSVNVLSANTESDTLEQEKYEGYEPDTLLQLILTTKETDPGGYLAPTYNSSAKLFIQKMKEMRSRETLAKDLGLPAGSLIVEIAKATATRSIICWIKNPHIEVSTDEDYSCPTVTSGTGYFTGKIFFSLIDTRAKRLINSLEVDPDIVIPYAILNPEYASMLGGLKYHAKGGTETKPGMAQVLFLDDYNGDGTKNEFAIYEQYSCVACVSSLYGYSVKGDSLIHYPCLLNVTESNSSGTGDTSYTEIQYWPDHAFQFKADKDDSIVFDMDYRGRAATFDRYALHYNKLAERFEGTLQRLTDEQMKNYPASWYVEPGAKH